MRKTSGAIVAILLVIGAAAAFWQATRPATVVAPTASTSGSLLMPTAAPPTAIAQAPTSTPTLLPTPTPMGVLRPDGMATIAAPGVVVWSAPGTGKAKALTPTLSTGSRLFLTRGPHHAHGFDWWEVQVEYRPSLPSLFGWIPFGTFTQTPSGHPDPRAVMACRQTFVVTAATKLP